MKEQISEVKTKIFNPIELFSTHFINENKELMEAAWQFRAEIDDGKKTVDKIQSKYYSDC